MHARPPTPTAAKVLLAGTFMAVLDFFIVNIALPSIRSSLGASDAELQLVVAAYAIAYGCTLMVGSRLGDRFGRDRMFTLGIAGFTAASITCGIAQSASGLITGRALQGLAAALFSPQVLAIINDRLQGGERKAALASYGLVMGLASVVAQTIGGALITLDASGLGWRWCFLVNVPVGLLVIVLASRRLPTSRSSLNQPLDLGGMFLFTATAATLATPLILGREQRWPAWSVAALVGFVPLAVATTCWERGVAAAGGHPLIPSLSGRTSFKRGLAAQALFFMSMAGFYLVLAIYLQQVLELSALRASLLFAANGAAYMLAAWRIGLLPSIAARNLVRIGAASRITGLLMLCGAVWFDLDDATSLALLPGLALNGAGTGLMLSPLASSALDAMPIDQSGAAAGMLNSALQLGNAIGVALIGFSFFTPAGMAAGFARSTLVLAALLLAVVIVLPVKRSAPT